MVGISWYSLIDHSFFIIPDWKGKTLKYKLQETNRAGGRKLGPHKGRASGVPPTGCTAGKSQHDGGEAPRIGAPFKSSQPSLCLGCWTSPGISGKAPSCWWFMDQSWPIPMIFMVPPRSTDQLSSPWHCKQSCTCSKRGFSSPDAWCGKRGGKHPCDAWLTHW